MLENASLPTSGPGTKYNGNFVLTELTLNAGMVPVPVPVAFPLLLAAMGGLGLVVRRRNGSAA